MGISHRHIISHLLLRDRDVVRAVLAIRVRVDVVRVVLAMLSALGSGLGSHVLVRFGSVRIEMQLRLKSMSGARGTGLR